jgi:hypothetical protein
MTRTTAQRALIASILSITASSWAQTPIAFGRAGEPDHPNTSHAAKAKPCFKANWTQYVSNRNPDHSIYPASLGR